MLFKLGVEDFNSYLLESPMRKDRSKATESYRQAAQDIAALYLSQKRVAITAEGDAGLYSSVHYIGDQLEEMNIPVEYIAGIPSFVASAALAKIHLVSQEEELDLLPGICSLESLSRKIRKGHSVVILKTSQSDSVIKEMLLQPKEGEVNYFENVGVQDKEFYTHNREEILSRTFPYFSLIIFRK